MKLIRHVAHVAPATWPRVVGVGRFDGVHVGHQRVLARCVERAAALGGVPLVVLRRLPTGSASLTGLREQLELFGAIGIGCVVRAPAGDASGVALAQAVGASVLVVCGSAPRSESTPLAVDTVQPVELDGRRVDADGIRAAVARADLADAARRLGREHAVSGRVIHGHHRGRPLGIPTANIRVRGVQLPPDGVYAVRARVGNRQMHGVANIGFNPTFANRDRSVETHLLDFEGDLYGQRLHIAFAARLRGEQKFAGVEALLAQIRGDIAAARRLFAQHGS
jgi:riboflavin kinase/FMN adenylyltransferase